MSDIQIFQHRVDDNHLDSFWYDGLIATSGRFELIANGEIRIYLEDKDGNYLGMYDRKARDDFIEPKNDQELQKMYCDEDGYRMENNNWFEIVDEKGESVGDICDDYDKGIEWLKEVSGENL